MQAFLLNCEYDSANRLVSVTNTTPTSTTTESITYDAEDKRLKDTINSGQSTVAYQNTPDSDTQVSETLAGSDKGVRYTIEAPNGAQLWDYTGGTPRMTLTDHQSTVAAELNPTDGHVTNTQDYDVYGAPAPSTVSALTTNTEAGRPTGYTGMREDVAGETTHHQARDLSAEYRIWTTTDQYEDPNEDVELAQGFSTADRTGYGADDPVNAVDPDGHSPQWMHFWNSCSWICTNATNAVINQSNQIWNHPISQAIAAISGVSDGIGCANGSKTSCALAGVSLYPPVKGLGAAGRGGLYGARAGRHLLEYRASYYLGARKFIVKRHAMDHIPPGTSESEWIVRIRKAHRSARNGGSRSKLRTRNGNHIYLDRRRRMFLIREQGTNEIFHAKYLGSPGTRGDKQWRKAVEKAKREDAEFNGQGSFGRG